MDRTNLNAKLACELKYGTSGILPAPFFDLPHREKAWLVRTEAFRIFAAMADLLELSPEDRAAIVGVSVAQYELFLPPRRALPMGAVLRNLKRAIRTLNHMNSVYQNDWPLMGRYLRTSVPFFGNRRPLAMLAGGLEERLELLGRWEAL